ncbi:MAG: gamma-glutamyl-gamma-aminobutyrate hydrolase family protein [Parachlamydiaceae bacterium]
MNIKKQNSLPIIGISATLLTIETGCFIGKERIAVLRDYIDAIALTGGIPIVLPVVEGKDQIEKQMSLVDGLLLSGGYDVSPLFYNEEPQRWLETIRPQRDLYEFELVDVAKKAGKPMFGICRGAQLLNVAFGGTLYQDIGAFFPSAFQHHQTAKPDEAIHSVQISSGSKLSSILGKETLLTNSFHHQSIKDIAPELVENARTFDGIIEGIEGKGEHFVLGVQWHPELMVGKHPIMLSLFRAFIEASRRREE